MPELPEVETTMRAMRARLCGRRIDGVGQWRADLRFPLPPLLPERLEGRRIDAFERRAKYIVMHLSEGLTALMHLGMSGRFLFDGESRGMHEHLTFRFDDGSVLRYVDPRRFGMLDLVPTAEWRAHRWIAHLGFEPLDPAFDGAALQSCLKNRLQAVKTAIMDQRLVVGVGNIYASESLFRAGISPVRKAASIGPVRARRLALSIHEVLEEAIGAGGSSLRDYVAADGQLGNFQSFFRVYGREGKPCATCGEPVSRSVQGGRATFFCRRCQR
ncbi:MAG: bifunctional DNA-formamidopyrimidine glycosylase/DNA-(apurinic or apyrimidinic site) lyase [Geminicoccaceae bacterium]|nr:bifunctional DNA-formamidopyrimidine glycosylase/DNA-(apurinic or apyrimidinic site) lyase [Geminicoccaceae bacterium]